MQTDMERGVQTYNLLCQALEENEWKYDKDDEKLSQTLKEGRLIRETIKRGNDWI